MPKVNKKAKHGKQAGDDETKYLTRKTPRDISYRPATRLTLGLLLPPFLPSSLTHSRIISLRSIPISLFLRPTKHSFLSLYGGSKWEKKGSTKENKKKKK